MTTNNNPKNIAYAVHVSLNEKFGPTLKRIQFLGLGDKLKAVLTLDYTCMDFDLESSKAEAAIAFYLPMVDGALNDSYQMYIREVEKHNEDARYDRRKKAKVAMTFESFKAKHGNILA
jgi:hypothetical protein